MAKAAPELSARDKRLRVNSITLRDFRAFPGPDETVIKLSTAHKDGCNLLLFGENGSGKSSLFEAFRGLFARRASSAFFKKERNRYSGQPEKDAHVTVAFTDGNAPAKWTVAEHPGRTSGDPRVRQTALRTAMLDYRALLDTNYGQGTKAPEWFDIGIKSLLADYPVVGRGTLGVVWQDTLNAKPNVGWNSKKVDEACADFNTEFAAAVDVLSPFAKQVLADLKVDGMELERLEYGTVRYVNAHQRRDRVFADKLLRPHIKYREQGIDRPQFFLNEARQSALALAIYLGARLACTQNVPEGDPKLLVLDDLLIGLDQSNRLHVLDVLMKRFSDWQIILLTHDRVWFDMARAHLQPATDWAYLELHDTPTSPTTSMPVVRELGPNAAISALDQADEFCEQGHIAAAATYARTAFELALRRWAETGSVKIRFRTDHGDLSSQELIDAIRDQKARDPNSNEAKALKAVEMFRTVVLNPMSHAAPPGIVKSEVQGAIAAVRFMISVYSKK